MHTIRSKDMTCDCTQEYIHVDFSQPSAIDMEAQVHESHQLRAQLLDLVYKRMDRNTCNKPSAVRQIIVSNHCIVLKMTYDMRHLTYFFICKVNLKPFILLGSRWGCE